MIYQTSNKWVLASIIILFMALQATVAQDSYGDSEVIQITSYTLIDDWQLRDNSNVQFRGPNAIVIDAEDNIYVTEFMGNRVQKFNPHGELITVWGSEGSNNGQFRNPTGIALDSDGNVYVSESGNSRVQKFTSDGEWLATWGSQGSGNGQFLSAMVINVDDNEERVYVSDWGNSRIQVFDTDGKFLMTWGERGSEPGQLLNPTGVMIDSYGNVWVVDRGNNRVQSFTPNGEHLSTWGSQGSDDGQFMAPTSIAIDIDGLIYISEADGTRVQVFTPEGDYLSTPLSILNSPHGMDFDSDGALFITDTFNGVIRKMERNTNDLNSATHTSLAPLPQRLGERPSTTGNVPHQQIGIEPVLELNDTLFRWVASLPNIELQPSISSLPGATGIWVTQSTAIAQPQAILNGREFTHIHPDGSLHAPLPLARALEAVEMGWAERHPWAEQRVGWEGLVMLYTPQSEADLEIVFQLIVESYNYITGRSEVATDYSSP